MTGPSGKSVVAIVLSLWPLALFAFSMVVTWVLFFSMAAGAGSISEVLWNLFGNSVYHMVMGQMAGASLLLSSLAPAALLSALIGTVMGFALRASHEDGVTARVASRAGVLGLLSVALYALLFWSWSGFGR